ncbi:hypothetical protein BDZ97DRAFT_1622330, partial [Flammula alnicola]
IQKTTREILARYPKINYLIMSPGIMTLSGRDETAEGINKNLAVHYILRVLEILGRSPSCLEKEEGGIGAVMSLLG